MFPHPSLDSVNLYVVFTRYFFECFSFFPVFTF